MGETRFAGQANTEEQVDVVFYALSQGWAHGKVAATSDVAPLLVQLTSRNGVEVLRGQHDNAGQKKYP